MPLNSSKRKRSNTRTWPYAALLAALTLLAAATLFGVGASAQRAKNDNAQQQGRSSRRIIVGRGSDTPSGSRTTITADDSLADYQAYRSGDRFVVVLPKSAAGSIAKGSGKGYTDVDVQQRGNSVVVSYKIQPGAKPHIEQKFNRLDVVFNVDGEGKPAGQQTAAQQPAENRNPNATAQQQQATQQPRTSETPANPNDRRAAEAASSTTQPGALNPSNTAAQTGQPATQPEAAQTQATPAAGEQSPLTAPTAEPQVAQNQPPAPIAPITRPDNPAANAQAGTSFAATLMKNWPIPLFVALLVIGLGLVVFTRRSSSHAPAELEASTVATTTATKKKTLEEPRAVSLKAAKVETVSVADVVATKPEPIAEAKPAPVAEAMPLVAPATVANEKKKKKKQRKGKARGGRVEELPLAESKADEETLLESAVAAEPAEVSEPLAEDAAQSVEEHTVEVAAPSVEEAAVAEPEHSEASAVEAAAAAVEASAPETEVPAAETHAFISTQPVEEVAEAEATREISLEPSVEPSLEPEVAAAEASAIEPVAGSGAQTVTTIAPASAPDPEDVQTATRRLLEGETYDRSVIGSEDSMARQLIGAELLSALAGRNAERGARARAAFVEHGYFDEKVRDVRDAAAPAERAAAARSLAIVGERNAAPHLIAALEDDSMEVRRAAVEALGALREPTAVEPLEALLRREKSQRNRIPNRIIQHAIETCRLAAAEALAPPVEEPAPQVEEAAPIVEEAAASETAVAPALEEEAPAAAEVAQTFEAAQPSVEPTLFETQPEPEAAVEAQPVVESAPVEEPWLIEEPEPVEEAQAAEEPSHVGEVPALEESAFELELEDAGTPVAESNAVEPFFTAPQAFEPSVAEPQVAEGADAFAEAPSVETAEESDDRSVSPFVSSSESVESAKAGEWEEFDVSSLGSTEAAQTAPPSEPVFEFSSGATMQAEAVAEPEPQTPEVESRAPETFEETHAFESGTVETAVEEAAQVSAGEFKRSDATESAVEHLDETAAADAVTAPLPSSHEKGVVPFDENSIVPAAIQQRLASREASVRATAITELSHLDTDEAFQQICSAFDDESKEVRSAAARSLYELRTDRADSFTRALREADSDRRRNIGAAVSTSGLASEAISQLTGESRDKTYEAFSLLFLMAKAGEVQPLVRAIEGHPNNEVRLAVVKLLALSGQKEILPAFRRLAVRGSLPTEVRSAVMEAIYQISSSQPTTV
ncbi:MAG TPA: HEAT repeat domain-containing protein [Pyrinomonadaceae bacterium]|jgi:HEAT repeat protein|nr:HEAT repeat domain-containing protein [Pyrinomonadaceae bacterium]